VLGERLNDGLSALAMGHGPPLVVLPGRGHFSAPYDRRLKPAIAAFLAEPAGE
jgi:hypothetical protein